MIGIYLPAVPWAVLISAITILIIWLHDRKTGDKTGRIELLMTALIIFLVASIVMTAGELV